jgi:hypothetical protein
VAAAVSAQSQKLERELEEQFRSLSRMDPQFSTLPVKHAVAQAFDNVLTSSSAKQHGHGAFSRPSSSSGPVLRNLQSQSCSASHSRILTVLKRLYMRLHPYL